MPRPRRAGWRLPFCLKSPMPRTTLRKAMRACPLTSSSRRVVSILLALALSPVLYVYLDTQFNPDSYLPASPHLTALELRAVSWFDLENDGEFLRPRDRVVSPLPRLVITPTQPCRPGSFMVALVTSPPKDFPSRQLIRNTWAGAVRRGQWPGQGKGQAQGLGVSMDVFFVLGQTSAKENADVAAESRQHGDLIVGEFRDSYRNLTLKTLSGLGWVAERCLHTRFVMKVDQDTLVDLPRLTAFLAAHQHDLRNAVIGKLYFNSQRHKKGKWRVTADEYPFAHYPTFAGGPCYLISTDAVTRMVNVSRYLPSMTMEDVYVTGLLAHAAHVQHRYMQQLRNWYEQESPCVFLQTPAYQVSLTELSFDRLRHVWDVLTTGNCLPFPTQKTPPSA